MKDAFFSDALAFRTYSLSHSYQAGQPDGAAMHYFAYLEYGTCRIVSGQITIEAHAGDIFYIPKGLPYRSYWTCDNKVQFKSLGFHSFPECTLRQYSLQIIACDASVKEQMLAIPTEQPVDSALLGAFYTMLTAIVPHMRYNTQSTKSLVIEKAKQYILLHNDCNVPDIARHCLLSEAALYDLFRKEAQCTPNEMRQQILCEKAVLLLSTTDRSVQDISDSLSFSSTSYFRKVLYKHTGKTPRQIRRAGKNI